MVGGRWPAHSVVTDVGDVRPIRGNSAKRPLSNADCCARDGTRCGGARQDRARRPRATRQSRITVSTPWCDGRRTFSPAHGRQPADETRGNSLNEQRAIKLLLICAIGTA